MTTTTTTRKFHAIDVDGVNMIGTFDSYEAAAGACQDAARESDTAEEENESRVVECIGERGCPCGAHLAGCL